MGFDSNIHYTKGNLSFSFLPTGDIYEIKSGYLMLNQLKGNYLDGSLMNIYLRIFTEKEILSCPLLGIHSTSEFFWSEESLIYEGCFHGISYQVTFLLTGENYWFYTISIEGEEEVDLIYGQDLGLSGESTVISNEAYVSQYIDHCVNYDKTYGYNIISKQNQPEAGKYPFAGHGCLTFCEHFSTDGFQFYGLGYKENNSPECLARDNLADMVYQYEFAYAALQSKRITLKSGVKEEVVFYGYFDEAPTADLIHDPIALRADELYQNIKTKAFYQPLPNIKKVQTDSLKVVSFSEEELQHMYPEQILLEKDKEQVLSFYTPDYGHVVTKEKEMRVERAHGLIIQTGHDTLRNEYTLATTSYIYGIFNSQIVLGNTSFHKLISNARNPLNIFKNSGQRIWIKDKNVMKLLSIPSLFEMGINYCKWIYKMEEDQIEVLNYVVTSSPDLYLQVKSQKGWKYQFYITNHIVMGENEDTPEPVITCLDNFVTISSGENTMAANTYPELCYRMQVHGEQVSITDDSVFFKDGISLDKRMLLFSVVDSSFELRITGNLFGGCDFIPEREFVLEKEKYYALHENMLGKFKLYQDGKEEHRLNITVWWYMHNAWIHYVSPHGIEQYGGAAWGTRDVCQGPFEAMIAFSRYDEAKSILLNVYSHQFYSSGDWPQWFMFDRYINIQAEDSHGDIIVWPLKILGDYLEITGDYEILDIVLPYCDYEKKQYTEEKETIFSHVKRQIEYIFHHTMFDTALSNYGNGDWDDTLQPDNPSLKASMVSSWTVALTYQAVKKFASLIHRYDSICSDKLSEFAAGIEKDFREYLIYNGTVSGFVMMDSKEEIQYLLHPEDKKTGITYRLLPMTRSMIAELFSEEEAERHIKLIHEHLRYNDGVRLMDKPIKYLGGKTVYFKRGEQAANFGREIGLLYIHATIRYIEAMCVMGDGKEALESFYKITPAGIWETVSNAMPRQGNLYFSSSDAVFMNRYEAGEEYDKLKKEQVAVKSGWRLYSSGPGIYINQLVTGYLGIRRKGEKLILDPVIHGDGRLSVRFTLSGYDVQYEYLQTKAGKITEVVINGNQIPFETYKNKYRQTGAVIWFHDLEEHLTNTSLNIICIRL